MEALGIEFLFVFLRAFGFILIIPWWGDSLSLSARFGVAIVLAFFLFEPSKAHPEVAVEACCLNFLLGLVLGIPLSLLIAAGQNFGELFDLMRGQNIGSVIDPLHPNDTVLGRCIGNLVWVWLLNLGVLQEGALILESSNADLTFSLLTSQGGLVLAKALVLITTHAFCTGLVALLSIVIVFLVVEIVFLFFSRLVPGVAFQSEVFQIKAYAGLLVLLTWSDVSSGALLGLAFPNWVELLGGQGA